MNSDAPFDIIGMGSCTWDHLLMIPHMPEYGVDMRASQYLNQSGGLVASALVAATRLGAKTKIIARIGDDKEGEFIHRELERDKVDTSKLLVEARTHSHVSTVLVDSNTGERTIISRWATGSPIGLHEFTREEITSAKILLIDNITEGTLQAAKWANEAGMIVIFDPACTFDTAKELLPWVTVPIVPEQFANQWLPNQPVEETALALRGLGSLIAIVTLGERGCVVCSSEGMQTYPAFPVDVVDTTGAGDAFHGAFMYGLLQDWNIQRMTKFASAVGAMNCRFLGGRVGLPTRREVDNFIANSGMD